MKHSKLFITSALTVLLGLGVGAGISFGKTEVKQAKATATAHSMIVKFGGFGNWTDADAKLAVYLWKGEGASKVETWTNTLSLDSSQHLYKLDYSFDGTPTQMIISRQSSSAGSTGSWDTSWAKSADLSFNEAIYIDISGWTINTTSGWTLSAQVKNGNTVKTTLSKIGINDAGNPEVSGEVTLALNEQFYIHSGDDVNTGYYGRPDALANCFTGGSTVSREASTSDIKCLVAGTYDFFFDTETKRTWISRDDIVLADGYAKYFLDNLECDVSGATAPAGWSKCQTQYTTYFTDGDARDYLCGATGNKNGDQIARCVYWYDYALNAHPSLTNFMVDSHDTPRNAAYVTPRTNITSSGANTTVVIAIIASVGLVAVGSYFLIRRKREN